MSETLYIRLPAAHSASRLVQWLLADSASGRLASVMHGPLSEAAALAANRRVVALAPGSDTLLAELQLPAKAASKARQMAPFAIEEQLACDVGDMHFGLGKRDRDGKTCVAAVTHDCMRQWLEQLNDAGLHPDALYPEAALLPVTPQGVTLVIDQGTLYRRGLAPTGLTLEAQPLAEALALLLPSETDAPITVYIAQTDYDALQGELAAAAQRHAQLQIKLLPEGPLPLFAVQASNAAESPLDLLQDRYERPKSLQSTLAPWRVAALLAATAFAMHLAYNGAQLWRLTRMERQLDRQLAEIASQTLPGATGGDIRKMVESRLNALRGGGAGGLMTALSALGGALAQTPDARIEMLAYRNKTVELRLTAPSVDALDKIRALTQVNGLQSELQGTTPREKNVEGRLQLKTPGA